MQNQTETSVLMISSEEFGGLCKKKPKDFAYRKYQLLFLKKQLKSNSHIDATLH